MAVGFIPGWLSSTYRDLGNKFFGSGSQTAQDIATWANEPKFYEARPGQYMDSGLPKSSKEESSSEGVNWSKLFSDFGQSLNRTFESSARSAMDAERAAADRANAFTRSERLAAQDFSSRQAELAYQRSLSSAREANAFTRSERLAAQDFYERMSSTAYQRAMSDMRAAGLNPILAYTQGGASASSVSAGSGQVASAPAASSSGRSGAKASMSSAKSADQQLALGLVSMIGGLASNIISSGFDALFGLIPSVSRSSSSNINRNINRSVFWKG